MPNQKYFPDSKGVICPECDSNIEAGRQLKKGMIVECQRCGTESEIIEMTPLLLAPLEEEK